MNMWCAEITLIRWVKRLRGGRISRRMYTNVWQHLDLQSTVHGVRGYAMYVQQYRCI